MTRIGKTLAEVLGEFAVNTGADQLPTVAIERAKMSLASTIASAAMGYVLDTSRIIRDLELESAGAKQSLVWFHGARLPASRAARVNALSSDAAASDDSDLRSIAHIGTIVSTTALAMGEKAGRSGLDLLAAMVLGYEVAGRIDESLTPGRMQRGFHGSVSTIFGGAVVAGRLLGLDTRQMAHAIALAATSAGGMAIAADTSCAREYGAGNSAMLGIHAAQAAKAGFEAELFTLEAPRGFLSAMNGQCIDEITANLGRDWDIATDMAIKLMPGAHPFHATAEAAAVAARDGDVRPDDVDRVLVSAAVQWTNFKGSPHPRNLVDAAHSLVYFVAASVVERRFDWDAFELSKMSDPVIAQIQDRVEFDPHPDPLPDRFPHRHGGSVTIFLKDGREISATCVAPRGSGPRGVDWADLDEKYRRLVPISGLRPQLLNESLEILHSFEAEANTERLLSLLVAG